MDCNVCITQAIDLKIVIPLGPGEYKFHPCVSLSPIFDIGLGLLAEGMISPWQE